MLGTRVLRVIFAAGAVAGAGAAAGAQGAASSPDHAGPAPIVKLSATTLGFGSVVYGGAPASQTLTLSNTGTAALQIQGMSISGNHDFTVANDCGASVAAGGQCRVILSFAPHAIGARQGTLSIKTNAAGSPHKVQASGAGCRYFSPAAARFFLTTC